MEKVATMTRPRLIITCAEVLSAHATARLTEALYEWYQGRLGALILPVGLTPHWEPTPRRRPAHRPSTLAHRSPR